MSPSPDQQQDAQPLLSVTWVDLGSLPFAPGEATTTDQAYAQYLTPQWQHAYQEAVADLLQDGDADPYTLETAQQIADLALQVATGRLDQYEERLRAYLATQPSEDDLVDWLANRAMVDAGMWARQDALTMRRQAQQDYYERNPKPGRYRIAPDSAAEPRCRDIAGNVYDSAAEAEAALGSVWHIGCIHYIEPAAA